ncbi:hypothetical protein [Brevundimonas sp.]|uniref:hypothetical protein n=1 Tax=Brevundimonas sp. TaxID=1871086 RepID=UPI002737D0A7|nr:hypothetical protein [Brevundimonas sp.]MDP3802471.1 hypothetical protein [Brevundimonas sp.]
MSLFVSLISAGLLVLPGQAAQDPAPPAPVSAPDPQAGVQEPAVELGAVEVTGPRPVEERAAAFIDEVAAAPRGRGLGRWDRAICVGAANMSGRYARFMIDRVSTVALDLGLEIGEPGCRPNIMIAAAADADELAVALVRDDPNGFRPALNQTDLGSRALALFQTTDAPVRWWHVSLPVSVDTGDVAIRLNGEEAPAVRVRDVSRLRANVRDDLVRVVIILDTPRIGRISYGALSDYVALVALAQIDPAADTSDWPSVLNLFTAAEPPAGLTDWDRDYLQSLYAARRDRARPTQQAREIVSGMVDARTREPEPETEPETGAAPTP